MVEKIRLERARGAMLGAAVGDALGAPLEGLCSQQIHQHYVTVDDYVDGSLAWKKKPYRWRMPGNYTDDTQQALVLCDVLIEKSRIDTERVAALYLALARPPGTFLGSHRGAGRSFRLVLEGLQSRQKHAGRITGQISAGAGAASRIVPIPIYFADDPDGMIEAVLAASLMTHRDCRGLTGAVAVAHAIRYLMTGAAREPNLLFRVAADVHRVEKEITRTADALHIVGARTYPHCLSRAIARVEKILELPHRDDALAALVQEANHHGPSEICRRPTMGFAPALIPTCFYVFLTTDSFEEALVEIVNLGGDADTAGAILGAMAGAYYDVSQIPSRWLERLQNREGITARADALVRRDAGGANIPDLVATERRLSELEVASRGRVQSERQSGGDMGANRRL